MKNTISADLHTQAMTCRVCGKEYEIPRKLLRDQDALLQLVDETAADHRECAAQPDNPRLAALHRGFRKRLERADRPTETPRRLAA